MPIGDRITEAVTALRSNMEVLLRSDDMALLPSVALASFDSCDDLPAYVSAVYLLRHLVHGCLYIGKARNLRGRWRTVGEAGSVRVPTHQHYARCLEVGGISLSWIALDEGTIEIAETIAIELLDPPWNISKRKSGHQFREGVPAAYCETFEKEFPYTIPCKPIIYECVCGFKFPAQIHPFPLPSHERDIGVRCPESGRTVTTSERNRKFHESIERHMFDFADSPNSTKEIV